MLRFAVVGLISLAIDLGLLNVLMAVLGLNHIGGNMFIAIKALSYISTIGACFAFNKISKNSQNTRKLTYFFSTVTIGLIIDVSVSYTALRFGMNFLTGVPIINMANGAAVVGASAAAFSNMFGYAILIFKGSKPLPLAESQYKKKTKTYKLAI